MLVYVNTLKDLIDVCRKLLAFAFFFFFLLSLPAKKSAFCSILHFEHRGGE